MSNHPITPPPELVQQWLEDGPNEVSASLSEYVATKAARWGADQELEACVDWMRGSLTPFMPRQAADQLRTARRPKPPSLKERLSKAIIDGDEKEALKLLEQLDD